jgi:hypothetical protein
MSAFANFFAFFFDRVPRTEHISLRSKGLPATYNPASNNAKLSWSFSCPLSCRDSGCALLDRLLVSYKVQFTHGYVKFFGFLVLP